MLANQVSRHGVQSGQCFLDFKGLPVTMRVLTVPVLTTAGCRSNSRSVRLTDRHHATAAEWTPAQPEQPVFQKQPHWAIAGFSRTERNRDHNRILGRDHPSMLAALRAFCPTAADEVKVTGDFQSLACSCGRSEWCVAATVRDQHNGLCPCGFIWKVPHGVSFWLSVLCLLSRPCAERVVPDAVQQQTC